MNAALDWFYSHPAVVIPAYLVCVAGLAALIGRALHRLDRSDPDDRSVEDHRQLLTHLDPTRRHR